MQVLPGVLTVAAGMMNRPVPRIFATSVLPLQIIPVPRLDDASCHCFRCYRAFHVSGRNWCNGEYITSTIMYNSMPCRQ